MSSKEFATLAGKRAVVTGSSSGIGRAIALELARAGADVLVHYARSKDKAESVAAEVQSLGVDSHILKCDLASDHLEQFVEQTWNQQDIDIWVNNAGVDLLTGAGKSLSYEEKLQQLLNIDVTGSVLLSRYVAKQMAAGQGGCILNIGWDQSDRGMEGDSGELFSTAKNAIMGVTRSLAVTYAPKVRINCIAPGWIRTAWGDTAPDAWQARVLQETPLNRWGEPQDIANLARFLVSEEASYITGQVINANGGAVR